MSLSITRGPSAEPLRVVITGGPGVGKTTFAAGAPDVLFLLASNEGSGDLDIARIPIATWAALRSAVRQLGAEPHPYRTVVLDTVDAFERLCWQHLCEQARKPTIEDVGGGYGKGYTAAVEEQQALLLDLDKLRARGIAVIALAHTAVKLYNDPEGPAYDRHKLAMQGKAAELWTGWADAVLFAQLDVRIVEGTAKTEKDKGKARDVKPARLLWTEERAAYTAKNRHNLPECIPLDWGKFAAAIQWDRRHPKPAAPAPTTPSAPAPATNAHPVDGYPSLRMLQTTLADAIARGWKKADALELCAPNTASADVPPERRMAIIQALNGPPPDPNATDSTPNPEAK